MSQSSGIPTIYQRLWFNDRELLDSSETVSSIGIMQDDVFEILEIEVSNAVDISQLRDVVAFSRTTSRKGPKTSPAEGFAGTVSLICISLKSLTQNLAIFQGLYGLAPAVLDSRATSLDGSDGISSDVAASATSIPCPVCTYLNAPTEEVCGVCRSPMISLV